MKIVALVLSCVLWEARGYPYYTYYGNMDTLAYGGSDNSRGAMVMSRYYNPYYSPSMGGGLAAFTLQQPQQPEAQQQYYMPDRRRQTTPDSYLPQQSYTPQENEVFYPPEKPMATEQPELDITEKDIAPTTVKAVTVPELVEPEIEEIEEQKPKKRVSKKKQERPQVSDEEDDEPKMPNGAFFPMFFGYGRNGGATPGGATAIANAYSTGRGGVATSHATAYGVPTPDFKNFQKNQKYY